MKNKIHQADQNFLDLLQRWLRGDFRRADEKSVQKLTDDDDFRREAMQGFSEFSEVNHSEKLAVLRQRLAEKTGAAPQLRVVWMQRMLAAAAVLVLVLGTVWLFQKQEISPEKTAVNLPQPAENQGVGTPAPENSDAKIYTENSAAPENQGSAADKILAEKPAAKPTISSSGKRDEITVATAPQSVSEDRPTDFSQPKMEAEMNEIVVADDKISPVRSAEVAPPPPSFEEKMAKENAADFSKKKMPTASKPANPAKSLPAGQIKHDTDAKPDLGKLRKKEEIIAAAEPIGGWDNFNEYIRQNARLTPEAAKQMNFGLVGLQFYPTPEGETGSIVITKSLGFGLDEEAKRLVKLFDWQPGKNNLVKLEIRFAR